MVLFFCFGAGHNAVGLAKAADAASASKTGWPHGVENEVLVVEKKWAMGLKEAALTERPRNEGWNYFRATFPLHYPVAFSLPIPCVIAAAYAKG